MKHGIYLPNAGPMGEALRVAHWAQEAEASGWDGLFLWDHVARPVAVEVVDPWIALAAAAMRTERLRLGALVTPIPRRRPWKLARETAALDRLSKGRLVVGVGTGSAGGAQVEWAAFDEEMDGKRRAAMLDEGLEILQGLWSGRPFSFSGTHYRVGEATFLPRPQQRPRIPIWVAGFWPHKPPLRRAARWDGVYPHFARGADRTSRFRDVVAYVESHGPLSPGFDFVFPGLPDEVDRAAADEVAAAGATWRMELLEPEHFGGDWTRWPSEKILAHIRAGPPR